MDMVMTPMKSDTTMNADTTVKRRKKKVAVMGEASGLSQEKS